DDMVILAFEVPRDGHPLRRRERGAGMSCAELVVLGLAPHEESRDAAELTERVELIPPASEHLVDVRLMTGVPHDLVARRIEHPVQRNGELDGAEARADVAAGLLHALDREVADLGAERADLGALAGTPADPLVMLLAADPGDRPAMERAVEQVLRAWGRLDVVANLVGGYAASDAAAGDLPAYRASWDQKVATAVTATTACLAPMRARGRGRVVSVGSLAALKGEKAAAGYAMANAALVRWTESLAEELKREGVTANCVLPRIIDTPDNRLAMPKADPSRWATPAEIAAPIVFLSS